MVASNISEERLTFPDQQSAESTVSQPDPSWRGLYRIGGISTFLYIIVGLILPTIMFIGKTEFLDMDGTALLEFIAANRIWYFVLQSLVLLPSILLIIIFVAVFVALKHLDKSLAALGTILAVTCQVLFVAYYPILMGLIYLSDRYVIASVTQQTAIAAGAEALLAQNNAFNPLYEAIFATSVLIFSIVMLKGVFHKGIAYLGMLTCLSAFVGMSLWPIIGIGYFWWWLLLMIWLVAVGWKLYRLGSI